MLLFTVRCFACYDVTDFRRHRAKQDGAAHRRLQRQSDDARAGVYQLCACAATARDDAGYVPEHVQCGGAMLHVHALVISVKTVTLERT